MAIGKKGMQRNSAAPKETMMTRDLSGKMEGKPMKGEMSKRLVTSGGVGGGGRKGKGKMGY